MDPALRPPRPLSDKALDRALCDAGARLSEVFPGYIILGHDTSCRMWWRSRDPISMRGMLERMLDRLRTGELMNQEDEGCF